MRTAGWRSGALRCAVRISNSGEARSNELVKNGKLKVYPSFPHGMCTTHPDLINPDLLAFIKS